jgi:hypothetical protein
MWDRLCFDADPYPDPICDADADPSPSFSHVENQNFFTLFTAIPVYFVLILYGNFLEKSLV